MERTPIGELIDDYRLKLKSVNALVVKATSRGDSIERERLSEKAGVYRSFITDMERSLPAERQAIEQAYHFGSMDGGGSPSGYFTKKYGTQ